VDDVGDGAFKKGAVMTDHEECSWPFVEEFLKNAKCVEVKIVRGFVEEKNLRTVHEGLDHTDLLPVSLRQFLNSAIQIDLQTNSELLDRFVTVFATYLCQKVQECSARHRRVETK